MNYISTTSEEKGKKIKLAYQDFGEGQPILLIHGWPLSQRMWEHQIPFFVNAGYRVITYDRRGFGQSDQPWNGYDYDTFASDLNDVITSLELSNLVLVGFSMGGGEIARYIGNYGTAKLSKVILLGAVVPFLLETDDNPHGVDGSVFEGMKQGIANDRAGFFEGFGRNFVNIDANKDRVSEAQVQLNWQIACSASRKGTLNCVDAFGKTDFRKDCEAFDIPTLILHGDDDAIVPKEVSAEKAINAIKDASLQLIKGGPHGLYTTHHADVNQAMLAFLE